MRLLVIRFSAMGDVTLTVPVLRGVLQKNPNLRITMVSNASFEPLFHDIDRLDFFRVQLDNYSGLTGLYQLFKKLKKAGDWDAVIDLHSVMRTWVLGALFKVSGVPVRKIDKGRQEKKLLVRKENKSFKQLKHSTERYLDVFKSFGVEGMVESGPVVHVIDKAKKSLEQFLEENELSHDKKWLGLAPFSKHKQKTWPLSKVTSLLEALKADGNYQIFLLGGKDDLKELDSLTTLYPQVINMAGKFSLDEEIALVHQLDLIISMDSFNMHLAALCGTKVISIWGGTHPFAGFGPLNDNDKYIVQVAQNELECRPCSVFGSKPCFRGDWACLRGIEPDQVLKMLK